MATRSFKCYRPLVDSDEELLARWRAGDQLAGQQLLSRHFRRLRTYFINKVDEESEVEELVQATLLGALEARDRMAESASVAAYLLGIARNLLFKHWRERSRYGGDIEEQSIAALGSGPSSILARHERGRLLLQALRQIPLKFQEVIELYYWEGLTGQRLGEVLGVGEDTARSKLRRAKRALDREYRRLERFNELRESSEDNFERWVEEVKECVERPTRTDDEDEREHT